MKIRMHILLTAMFLTCISAQASTACMLLREDIQRIDFEHHKISFRLRAWGKYQNATCKIPSNYWD